MNKRKKVKNHKNHKITKIVILIIALIAVFAIAFAMLRNYETRSPIKIYSLPLIETQVYSVSDGQEHNVKMNISFSIDRHLSKKYNQEELLQITTQTISDLDYDELNKPNGTQYLKNAVYDSVSNQYPKIVNENFNVYVSGYDLGLVNGYLPGLIQEDTFGGKLQQMFGS